MSWSSLLSKPRLDFGAGLDSEVLLARLIVFAAAKRLHDGCDAVGGVFFSAVFVGALARLQTAFLANRAAF